jgi:PPOX class probable FMN-dependent enzyme
MTTIQSGLREDAMIGELTYLASAAELRPLYNGPSALVRAKQIDRIDAHCRSFIARSPLVMIGSSHPERGADVSPRGDAPGFVQVLDEHHLAIPDRPGNNRLDTLENLLANPAVGLFFLVPGIEETLRVNGTARLSRSQPLLDIMAVDGKVPKLAIVVTVSEAFLHCAKALKRARLWADDYRIDRKQLPTLGRMIVEQARPVGLTAEEADARIEADYRTNLY